jgi:hypothetical protein
MHYLGRESHHSGRIFNFCHIRKNLIGARIGSIAWKQICRFQLGGMVLNTGEFDGGECLSHSTVSYCSDRTAPAFRMAILLHGGKRICKAAGLSHTRNMISKNRKEILLFEMHICAEIAGPIALPDSALPWIKGLETAKYARTKAGRCNLET